MSYPASSRDNASPVAKLPGTMTTVTTPISRQQGSSISISVASTKTDHSHA